MKVIELTKGQVAIVDDEDFEELAQYRWHYSGGYAKRISGGRFLRMHRVIFGEDKCFGRDIDHKNGNTLDNRKCNLRKCTKSQNGQNSKIKKNNKCGFKGVAFDKQTGKFRAQMRLTSGKRLHLGRFDKVEDASIAYQLAATKHFGEFARFN